MQNSKVTSIMHRVGLVTKKCEPGCSLCGGIGVGMFGGDAENKNKSRLREKHIYI